MVTRAKFSGIILLLLGVVIGALVFSQLHEPARPLVFSSPTPTQPASVVPSRDRTITSLRDLNNAFVEIAEAVNPTVVTVFTEKVLRVRQSFNPFSFFGDPFEDFFGPRFGPERGRRAPEREFRQQGLGSGVIVDARGYILTNNHVVQSADSIYVRTMDERTFPAKVIGADPRTDLAVIQVKADRLTAIKLGDSDQLRVGEWVLAIGSPLSADLAHTVTQGIVSAKGRSDVGLADYEDFIQTDAAINPGNSGGALVNLDGALVGINTAIASRSGGFQGIGFAVPINMASAVMNSLIKEGRVVRGYLGVNIQNIDQTMAKALGLDEPAGALVSTVVQGGPSDKAGLKEGDVIVELNGKKVKNVRQLRTDVAALPPGTVVQLQVLREGKSRSFSVTLGELPSSESTPSGRPESEELLGFAVAPMSNSLARKYDLDPNQTGVVVTDISAESPAYRAGLREGDLIRSVNRKRVQGLADFNALTKDFKSGDSVLLQVVRQDGSVFLAFELD